MSQITVDHLTFSYPGTYDEIFRDVTFRIDTDWKLGFIGRNGRGKTTFLRLLEGDFPYEGTISSSVTFDYFPYEAGDPGRTTREVLFDVRPDAMEWQFVREFASLEVDTEVLDRPFYTLSNGERTKALLAALFLGDGHFLLIDEPTNHLDLHAREVVSAYLRKKKGFIPRHIIKTNSSRSIKPRRNTTAGRCASQCLSLSGEATGSPSTA